MLVLVAAVPGMGLLFHEGVEQWRLASEASKHQALDHAREISREYERLIQSGHYLLQALVGLTSIHSHNSKQCNVILSKLVKAHPAFTNLGAATPDGEVFCSATPLTQPVNFADRLYFQQVLRTRDSVVSLHPQGPISGGPKFHIAYPAVDKSGVVQAVVFVGLSPNWLNKLVAGLLLPEDSAVTLRDGDGMIFARYPDPEKWTGKSAMDAPIFRAILSDHGDGATEAAGVDGVRRLYGFTKLRGLAQDRELYVTAGIPEEIAFAKVRERLYRDLTLASIVIALSLLVVWFGAGQFITHPVNHLLTATKRLAAGDLDARTGLAPGAGELNQLARSFDQMADSLEQQISERRRAEEGVHRNLQRIQALREIDRAISSSLDLTTILEVLLEKIELALPGSATTVRLLDKAAGALEPVACRNLDQAEWKSGGAIPLAQTIHRVDAPRVIDNVQTDPQTRNPDFSRKHRLVSCLRIPLAADNNFLGEISFYTREEHEFVREEIDFLTTLAGQAAIAIQNSQLYERTKRQAQELAKVMAAMDQANRIKDEFLSVMSHELRTPLNVVLGYTAMLRDGMLGEIPPNQKEVLGKVMHRANDLLTLIRDVLQATQIESRAVKVQRVFVNPADFFDKLRAAYQQPSDKELILVWDLPRDLPPMVTDGEKLKQILENLIHNAIKFTEKGSVTISARASQQKEQLPTPHASGLTPRPVVEFKVADTGIGVPKELLSVIFDKFTQADSSETRIYGGVGLGLYIVKKFTEMLGGSVEVESEVGKGSTFTVTIPVAN
ncbi:MAG: HAMP domain-containing protein [Candidatus Kerfeldbacteria bacterium]|nr:HAMP domain-containing protein [Candidatus Kerfeldbacteria bacterium]